MTEHLSGESNSGVPTYTIYVCPECGEHITESDYDIAMGRIWGHYHDRPMDWPEDQPDPWVDAEPMTVMPA